MISKLLKESLNKLYEEQTSSDIPRFLYHATYRPLIKSIKRHGLDNTKAKKNWSDSRKGVAYLATDPDIAISFAEESEIVPDDWLDEIIVLKITTSKLDTSKLSLDTNIIDNQGESYQYKGIISPDNIKIELSENINYTTTSSKKDLYDLMGDKTGEIPVTKFTLELPDGAEATGTLEDNIAVITRIQAPRNPDKYEPLRGTKTYDRVIEYLKQQGAKKLRVPNQSLDSRAALKRLLDKGILSNPKEIRGISVDEHPTLFDIR
jgi:hypothetical protein